jgi:hypothetical protein
MKTPAIKLSLLLLSLITLFVFACSKEGKNGSGGSGNKARLQVALTDDPGNYDAVFIDVQDIKINFTNDTANGWQSLSNVAVGQYDLLRLVNDDDTVLADAEIPVGRVHQIRLVLGPNNYVVINGQNIPLETPSAQQSGLKLNIQQDVSAGILYKLLLDFDVARSIHKTGNNRYMLKPVIRTVLDAVGGSIRGWVKPDSVTTSVLIIKGFDTVGTFTGADGGYFVRGLSAGTYTIRYLPNDTTFFDETKNNINVVTGVVTIVDTVHLHQ